MNITTIGYLIFVLIGLIIYYLAPQKLKSKILLIMSIIFSASFDVKYLIFIILVSLIAYISALLLDKRSELNLNKSKSIKYGRIIVTVCVVLDILTLFTVKYYNPLADFLNDHIYHFEANFKVFNIIIPLGISYYTLQTLSYIIDVYWKRYKADKNYFNILLFTSYFPLIIQGPISRYNQLSNQFNKNHKFKIQNIKYGIQLIIWGYFKKMIIADKLVGNISRIFNDNYTPYGLTIVAGLVFYGIQLYCDFSGGIDVIRGTSQLFDIELTENFRQPYFSKSLAEFWQRWHISLGAWMRDYVFYPISMSKVMKKLKKSLKGKISKKTLNKIPIAVAYIAVFMLVGIWHGASYKFFAWGLYNGIILSFSSFLTDKYDFLIKKFSIDRDSKIWKLFCIFRTLIIVNISWIIECTNTPLQTINMFKNMFVLHKTSFSALGISFSSLPVIVACLLLLFVSIQNERGYSVRKQLSNKNLIIQIIVWIALIQFIALFSDSNIGGFMYANF